MLSFYKRYIAELFDEIVTWKFGIFFATFQAEVVVERSVSIYFDPQTRLPLRGTSGQVSQIAQITPVPSADHVPVSLRGVTPEE